MHSTGCGQLRKCSRASTLRSVLMRAATMRALTRLQVSDLSRRRWSAGPLKRQTGTRRPARIVQMTGATAVNLNLEYIGRGGHTNVADRINPCTLAGSATASISANGPENDHPST